MPWVRMIQATIIQLLILLLGVASPQASASAVDRNLCPLPTGDFAIPGTTCTRDYSWCLNGVPEKHSCDPGLLFDPKKGACNLQQSVEGCGPKDPPELKCPRKNGKFRENPQVPCSPKYIFCYENRPISFTCSQGDLFDPWTGGCDSPEFVVGCEHLGKSPQITCDESNTERLSAVGCSHWFYWCGAAGSRAIELRCPGNLYFNGEKQVCDYARNIAECEGIREPHELGAFDCTGKEGNHPDDKAACSGTFYSCNGGTTFEQKCPGDLKYDVAMDRCDLPAFVVACGGKRTTTAVTLPTTPSGPSSVAFDCRGKMDGTKSSKPDESCSQQYVECVQGHFHVRSCPAELFYSDVTGNCEYRHHVPACGGTPVTTSAPADAATPSNFCTGKESGSYSLGRCKSLFLICGQGALDSTIQSCPTGTVFDPTTGICVSPQSSSECGLLTPQATGQVQQPQNQQQETLSFCSSKADGLYTSGMCSVLFIRCRYGYGASQKCPGTQVFDSKRSICDEPEHVEECPQSKSTSAPAVQQPPRQQPQQQTQQGQQHQQETQQQQSGVVQQQRKQQPSAPVVVQPPQQNQQTEQQQGQQQQQQYQQQTIVLAPIERTTTVAHRTTPEGFCADQGNGDFPTALCADVYVTCSEHETLVRHCPKGLKFAALTKQCDHPSFIPACAPIPDAQQAEIPRGGPCAGRTDGKYPDRNALPCTQSFIYCKSGSASTLRCQNSQFFHIGSLSCEERSKVPACRSNEQHRPLLQTTTAYSAPVSTTVQQPPADVQRQSTYAPYVPETTTTAFQLPPFVYGPADTPSYPTYAPPVEAYSPYQKSYPVPPADQRQPAYPFAEHAPVYGNDAHEQPQPAHRQPYAAPSYQYEPQAAEPSFNPYYEAPISNQPQQPSYAGYQTPMAEPSHNSYDTPLSNQQQLPSAYRSYQAPMAEPTASDAYNQPEPDAYGQHPSGYSDYNPLPMPEPAYSAYSQQHQSAYGNQQQQYQAAYDAYNQPPVAEPSYNNEQSYAEPMPTAEYSSRYGESNLQEQNYGMPLGQIGNGYAVPSPIVEDVYSRRRSGYVRQHFDDVLYHDDDFCRRKRDGYFAFGHCNARIRVCFEGDLTIERCRHGKVFNALKGRCVHRYHCRRQSHDYDFESYASDSQSHEQQYEGRSLEDSTESRQNSYDSDAYSQEELQQSQSYEESHERRGFCRHRRDGFYAYGGSCDARIHVCFEGIHEVQHCARGKVFSASRGRCVRKRSCNADGYGKQQKSQSEEKYQEEQKTQSNGDSYHDDREEHQQQRSSRSYEAEYVGSSKERHDSGKQEVDVEKYHQQEESSDDQNYFLQQQQSFERYDSDRMINSKRSRDLKYCHYKNSGYRKSRHHKHAGSAKPNGFYPVSPCSPRYYSCLDGAVSFHLCSHLHHVFVKHNKYCLPRSKVAACTHSAYQRQETQSHSYDRQQLQQQQHAEQPHSSSYGQQQQSQYDSSKQAVEEVENGFDWAALLCPVGYAGPAEIAPCIEDYVLCGGAMFDYVPAGDYQQGGEYAVAEYKPTSNGGRYRRSSSYRRAKSMDKDDSYEQQQSDEYQESHEHRQPSESQQQDEEGQYSQQQSAESYSEQQKYAKTARKAELKHCSYGLVFDGRHKKCVRPSICKGKGYLVAASSEQQQQEQYGFDSSEATDSNEKVKSHRNRPSSFRHPSPLCAEKPNGKYETDSCAQEFIGCRNGQASFRFCRSDQYFDQEHQRCIAKRENPVACAPSRFCRRKSDGVYAVAACSRDYVVCADRLAVKHRCLAGLVFNDRKNRCTPPQRIPQCANEKEPICLARGGRHGNGVFAIARCSAEYVDCRHGFATRRFCAPTQFFDQFRHRCVRKHNAPQCNAHSDAASSLYESESYQQPGQAYNPYQQQQHQQPSASYDSSYGSQQPVYSYGQTSLQHQQAQAYQQQPYGSAYESSYESRQQPDKSNDAYIRAQASYDSSSYGHGSQHQQPSAYDSSHSNQQPLHSYGQTSLQQQQQQSYGPAYDSSYGRQQPQQYGSAYGQTNDNRQQPQTSYGNEGIATDSYGNQYLTPAYGQHQQQVYHHGNDDVAPDTYHSQPFRPLAQQPYGLAAYAQRQQGNQHGNDAYAPETYSGQDYRQPQPPQYGQQAYDDRVQQAYPYATYNNFSYAAPANDVVDYHQRQQQPQVYAYNREDKSYHAVPNNKDQRQQQYPSNRDQQQPPQPYGHADQTPNYQSTFHKQEQPAYNNGYDRQPAPFSHHAPSQATRYQQHLPTSNQGQGCSAADGPRALGTCLEKYLICINGANSEAKCDSGKLFDADVSRCVLQQLCGSGKNSRDERQSQQQPGSPYGSDVAFYSNQAKQHQQRYQPYGHQQQTQYITYSPARDAPSTLATTPVPYPTTTVAPYGSGSANNNNGPLKSASDNFCARKNDGFYRHPTDCSRYVQCFRADTYIMNCAKGTVFNPDPKVNTCDFPQNVPECQLATIPSGDGPKDPECLNQPHGAFLRHPSSCAKYIRCVWNRKVEHSCPANLLFNTILNVCDYPSAVPECGGSLQNVAVAPANFLSSPKASNSGVYSPNMPPPHIGIQNQPPHHVPYIR